MTQGATNPDLELLIKALESFRSPSPPLNPEQQNILAWHEALTAKLAGPDLTKLTKASPAAKPRGRKP